MNLRELFGTVAFALTVAAAPAATNIAIPAPAEIIARLRSGHPRLLATASDFSQLKQRVAVLLAPQGKGGNLKNAPTVQSLSEW